MFHRMSALQLDRWQILTKEWFFKSKIGENVFVGYISWGLDLEERGVPAFQ